MNKPSHIAYAVRGYTDAQGELKSRFHEIGAAWPTKSGRGFNITLYAMPVDGQITLLAPNEDPPAPV